MVAVLIAGCVSFGSSQTPPAEGNRASSEGESTLTAIAQTFDLAMMIDLPERVHGFEIKKEAGARWTLAVLSASLDRQWIEIDGVQLMTRPERKFKSRLDTGRRDTMDLLRSLTDDELRRAVDGTLTIGELPQEKQAQLLRNALNWRGSKTTSFNPYPRETLEAFLETAGTTLLRLDSLAKFTVTLKDGRTTDSYDWMAPAKKGYPEDPARGLPSTQPDVTHAVHGRALDYGTGKVVTVGELLIAANKTFDQSFRIDGRVLDARVFVSGSYDLDTFQSTIDVLLHLRQLRRATDQAGSLDDDIKELAKRLARISDIELVRLPERVAMHDIVEAYPTIFKLLQRRFGLADYDLLKASQGFVLSMFPGYTQTIGTRTFTLDGKQYTTRELRRLQVGIAF